MEQLHLLNVRAHEPLVRHLEGKLWELREESNTNIYRLLYFFFSGRKVVILHGFQKKEQKTPRREIEIAMRHLSSFVTQQERKKTNYGRKPPLR
jgi:phage-related protein